MHKFNKIYNSKGLKLEKLSHFGQLFEPGGQKSCPFWKTFRICKTKKVFHFGRLSDAMVEAITAYIIYR